MTVHAWLELLQDASLSRWIGGSIWGYPIVGAAHVLAIAVFGGALLWPHLQAFGFLRPGRDPGSSFDLRAMKCVGLAIVLVTGSLLFAAGAVRYYESTFFRFKAALLVMLVLNAAAAFHARGATRAKLHSALALTLWAAVIFAARGIAYF
jgi:hypothetical protein